MKANSAMYWYVTVCKAMQCKSMLCYVPMSCIHAC